MRHPKERIRVLCVDDHRVVLDGIVLLIDRQPDMKVVAIATTGEEAIELCMEHRPDVILMDLQLPGISGLEAICAIRVKDPDARIIVLTIYQGDEDIHRALEAGAAGYLLKDVLSDELVQVVREVHAGGQSISPRVAAVLSAREQRPHLTPREIDVVRLIAKGMRNKEIAVVLGTTEDTAKVHVKNILAKLDVHDRAAVVGIALSRGIIHLS